MRMQHPSLQVLHFCVVQSRPCVALPPALHKIDFKVLTFLLYVYKMENISQRFDFYLEEKGRFKIFTFNLIQKLKKMKSLLHFNPEPLIRKMNKVLA